MLNRTSTNTCFYLSFINCKILCYRLLIYMCKCKNILQSSDTHIYMYYKLPMHMYKCTNISHIHVYK